jgi:transcriptional regulator with XRE-family HTH domain
MGQSMATREDQLVTIPEPPEDLADRLRRAMTEGERLEWTRRNAGYTQGQVAAAIGVSNSRMNRWETKTWDEKKNQPTASELVALRDFYGMDVEWILWVMGQRDTPPYLRGSDASPSADGQLALV